MLPAVWIGKLSARLVKQFQMGSGTSLPGKLALKLSPTVLTRLAKQVQKTRIAVTGTNGKSTTAGLIAALIEANQYKVVHNQLGANMLPGITAALVQQTSVFGKLKADHAVLEVDEASLPGVSAMVKQDLTLVTNLFRDQLDRYGELDTTAKLIQTGIQRSGGMMALNADDPQVTAIAHGFPPEKVLYYGVDAVTYPNQDDFTFPVAFPKEVMDCPLCQAPLRYSKILYGHLGHYKCSQCAFQRPTPHVALQNIDVKAEQTTLTFAKGPTLTVNLPGLFNAYNVLAALSVAQWLQLDTATYQPALNQYHSIFGRAERQTIGGKNVMILLIKNPTGAGEVLRVVSADPKARVMIAINDNYADGRDISWLWDAPFERLAAHAKPMVVSGARAADMAVRLKYANVPEDQITVVTDPMAALHQAVADTQTEETLYVLPTYTVLLGLSQALKSR